MQVSLNKSLVADCCSSFVCNKQVYFTIDKNHDIEILK